MKKRSLLVAVAMLLVAILAATGTTYAWFTQSKTATTTLSMNVASGSSLEISTAASGAAWTSFLDQSSLTALGSGWKDYSYDAENTTFYKAATFDSVDTSKALTYTAGKPIATQTIYFRSTDNCSDPKKLDKNTVMLLMRIESCIEQGSVLLVCF